MHTAAHPLAAAIEERIRELNHAIRFYEERGWDDLGAEYRVRLDEVQRLVLSGQVASMQEDAKACDHFTKAECSNCGWTAVPSEGESRAMWGNR